MPPFSCASADVAELQRESPARTKEIKRSASGWCPQDILQRRLEIVIVKTVETPPKQRKAGPPFSKERLLGGKDKSDERLPLLGTAPAGRLPRIASIKVATGAQHTVVSGFLAAPKGPLQAPRGPSVDALPARFEPRTRTPAEPSSTLTLQSTAASAPGFRPQPCI